AYICGPRTEIKVVASTGVRLLATSVGKAAVKGPSNSRALHHPKRVLLSSVYSQGLRRIRPLVRAREYRKMSLRRHTSQKTGQKLSDLFLVFGIAQCAW